MIRLIALFVFSLLTVPASGALLVSGNIVQEFTPNSWQEPFQITPDSLAIVVLEIGCEGEFSNRNCKKGIHQELKVARLPLSYAFETNDPQIKCTARNGERCFLSVLVNSRKGTSKVGDLFSEGPGQVISPARNFELKAAGLEPCNAPNAGGACL